MMPLRPNSFGHPAPVLPFAHDAHQIAFHQLEVVAWDDRFTASGDRSDHEIPVWAVLFGELRQPAAGQGSRCVQAGPDDDGLSMGHEGDLRRPGIVEQVEDPLRRRVVRIYDQIRVESAAHAGCILAAQLRGLDAHYGARHPTLLGDERCHQVHLVVAGHGDHEIAVRDACLREYAGMGAAALHGQHVEFGRQFAELLTVQVHDRHVVALPAESVGNV